MDDVHLKHLLNTYRTILSWAHCYAKYANGAFGEFQMDVVIRRHPPTRFDVFLIALDQW